MANGTVNRKYKDSLFRMIFSEKEELLTLYNAINGSSYTDPELLEVNTIEDVLYMGMKNDVSFLIGDYLNLYEEQSTLNPNMPLRGLFYFSRLYQGYVAKNKLDIYGRRMLALPMPKYIVFYIGADDIGESREMRLSDIFLKQTGEVPALECVATCLNVNYGHNQSLMAQCRKLREYSVLIARIRWELASGKELPLAVDSAVQYCIDHQVLDDFLRKHRAEVKEMILSGYADELHWESEKRLSYEAGEDSGFKKGEKSGFKKGEESGFEKGEKSGFKKGEESGFKKGEESGFRKGEESGFKKGEESGFKKGEESGFKKGEAAGIRRTIRICRKERMSETEILALLMEECSIDEEKAKKYLTEKEESKNV